MEAIAVASCSFSSYPSRCSSLMPLIRPVLMPVLGQLYLMPDCAVQEECQQDNSKKDWKYCSGSGGGPFWVNFCVVNSVKVPVALHVLVQVLQGAVGHFRSIFR